MDKENWYDKDLDDFCDPEFSSNEDLIVTKRKKVKSPEPYSKENFHDSKEYPFDIWYLIAMYIPPEDIGRFALICRTTNQVVHQVSFWMAVFKRYSKNEATRISRLLMKEHLSIVQTYIIRSIYQSYPLFQKRFDKTLAIQKDPHFLLSARCIRIWYSKRPTQRESYNYYFEFRFDSAKQQFNQSKTLNQPVSRIFQKHSESLLHRDSIVLHLISSTLVCIEPYMGMILSRLVLNVSSNYRYHKLTMWFNEAKLCLQRPTHTNAVVIIDPILCLRIYKWYNCPDEFD